MACRVSPHRKQHLCLFKVECVGSRGRKVKVLLLSIIREYIYRCQQQHLCWFKVQCVREREKRETKRKKEKEKTRENDRERGGVQGEGAAPAVPHDVQHATSTH